MKKIITLFFIILSYNSGYSNIDSLLQVLSKAKDDTSKVRLLRNLGWKYMLKDLDSSIIYYTQSLELAKSIGDFKGEAQSTLSLALIANRKGEVPKSLQLIRQALQIALLHSDHELLGGCYGRLARHYFTDDYRPDSTLYYFSLAEKEFNQLKDPYESWHLYMLRGELYFTLENFKKSEEDLLKAVELTATRKRRIDYGVALHRLVRNYFDVKNWEKYSQYAETYFRFLDEGDRDKTYNDRSHRGLYFFEDEENGKEVIPTLKQIAAVHEKLNNPLAAIDALKFLAEIELKNGRRQDAIDHLLHSADIAKRYHYLVDLQVCYYQVYKIYEEANNEAKAFYYFKQYKTTEDSVEILDNIKNFKELEIKYETEKKEQALSRQALELEKQHLSKRNLLLLISLLSLIAVAASGFLISKNKANKNLAVKNKIIEKSLSEKELLLREIHHRVKNNLQVISSLLNLQSSYMIDRNAKEAIKEGRNRVNSMSIIHQNLYMNENLVSVEVGVYLQKLSDSLFESYNINPDQIKFTTTVDPMGLDVDLLVPLGLIINELISNALKHAFPGNRQGEVHVILKNKEGSIFLEVRDNGIGIKNGAISVAKNSFGLEMVQAFADKLKATIEIDGHEGTRVTLVIPKQAA